MPRQSCGAFTPAAGGKGLVWNGYGLAWIDGSATEVTVAGSPYRYTAISPGPPEEADRVDENRPRGWQGEPLVAPAGQLALPGGRL